MSILYKQCRKSFFFMILVLTFSGCVNVPAPPPPATTCNFTILEPNNYSCYVRHQGAGVPTTKIKLLINLTTKYVNPSNTGVDYIGYDDVNFNFDPSTMSFPVTIAAKIPSKYVWGCEVNIQGTQCSECANGYGDPTESTGNCGAYVYTTSPLTYRSAIPRWQSFTGFGTTNISTAVTNKADRIPNFPNSCVCTVQ